jgi:hypothetical protein
MLKIYVALHVMDAAALKAFVQDRMPMGVPESITDQARLALLDLGDGRTADAGYRLRSGTELLRRGNGGDGENAFLLTIEAEVFDPPKLREVALAEYRRLHHDDPYERLTASRTCQVYELLIGCMNDGPAEARGLHISNWDKGYQSYELDLELVVSQLERVGRDPEGRELAHKIDPRVVERVNTCQDYAEVLQSTRCGTTADLFEAARSAAVQRLEAIRAGAEKETELLEQLRASTAADPEDEQPSQRIA